MAQVHASAVVDPAAQLADDVVVGPLVAIDGDVTVGPGSVLLPGTVLLDGSRVGARCRLGPYAVIGGRPEDREFAGEDSLAVLEDDVEVRDFASVHRASGEGAQTRVGAGSMIMCYAHVSHNDNLGRGVVLTNLVQLGGHVEIGDHAVLGAGAMVHQFVRVGTLAMLGADGKTNRDILPFALARGAPAEHFRANVVGLHRRGVDGERERTIQSALRNLRRGDRAALEALAVSSPDAALMVRFYSESRRGVAGFRGGR